jgi:hypothetical protein
MQGPSGWGLAAVHLSGGLITALGLWEPPRGIFPGCAFTAPRRLGLNEQIFGVNRVRKIFILVRNFYFNCLMVREPL